MPSRNGINEISPNLQREASSGNDTIPYLAFVGCEMNKMPFTRERLQKVFFSMTGVAGI